MADQKATNVHWHEGDITREHREKLLGHKGATSTALSPGSMSACMTTAIAFIADAVTLTRSTPISCPWRSDMYLDRAARNSGMPRLAV